MQRVFVGGIAVATPDNGEVIILDAKDSIRCSTELLVSGLDYRRKKCPGYAFCLY